MKNIVLLCALFAFVVGCGKDDEVQDYKSRDQRYGEVKPESQEKKDESGEKKKEEVVSTSGQTEEPGATDNSGTEQTSDETSEEKSEPVSEGVATTPVVPAAPEAKSEVPAQEQATSAPSEESEVTSEEATTETQDTEPAQEDSSEGEQIASNEPAQSAQPAPLVAPMDEQKSEDAQVSSDKENNSQEETVAPELPEEPVKYLTGDVTPEGAVYVENPFQEESEDQQDFLMSPAILCADTSNPACLGDSDSDGMKVRFSEAKELCAGLELDGLNNWHLAEVDELETILCQAKLEDYQFERAPDRDPGCTLRGGKYEILDGFAPASYWSATQSTWGNYYYIDFEKGLMHYFFPAFFIKRHFRCVSPIEKASN